MQKRKYRVMEIVLAGAVTDQEYEIEGERIYYPEGSIDLSIKLDSNSEDAIPLRPKQAITCPFKKFYLSSSVAGSVTLFVSKPWWVNVAGYEVDVDVVREVNDDQSLWWRASQGDAFLGGKQRAAVAAQFSFVGLWNPVGSGVNVLLEQIAHSGGAAAFYRALFSMTSNLGGAATSLANKLLGGAAPSCVVYSGTDAVYGGGVGTIIGALPGNANANVDSVLPLSRAVVIPPGAGLYMWTGTVNVDLFCFFEWLEVAV